MDTRDTYLLLIDAAVSFYTDGKVDFDDFITMIWELCRLLDLEETLHESVTEVYIGDD